MQTLNQTPNANRLHIGIYGRRNSGKSSLINAITSQDCALVSEFAGTTTDPVYKAMEVREIGACVFIDTAGFDDSGELGKLRVSKTEQTLEKTDVAILLFSDRTSEILEDDFAFEKEWLKKIKNTPCIGVLTHSDLKTADEISALSKKIAEKFSLVPIVVSNKTKDGIDELLKALVRAVPIDYEVASITGHLAKEGDTVMLIMPQDSEAPKGRLILPQVQVTRDLLDNKCVIISCTVETLDSALSVLKSPPKLMITDSQVFSAVYKVKPAESLLTSFSVLLAASKGDIESYINGANAIDTLNENSHILIAEACTHAPLSEDIGRVKIPMLLRKKYGNSIDITIVSGTNFPTDLTPYDLIVHCGGCMFNRKYLLSRIKSAQNQNVPITNYGILLAKLNGILDKIVY